MEPLDHFISATQISDRSFLDGLFALARKFERSGAAGNELTGRILASLFFEPSTRTRFSFESAMLRLGGQVISSENAFDTSSAKKGEVLEDTIRIVAGYADCILLRHPETGAAERAARVSERPIINAGDGSGEHPTQALVDIYTIQKLFGRVDGLHVALVGDFLYGRTVHSLVQLLSLYADVRLTLVAPPELSLPAEYKRILKVRGIDIRETSDFEGVLPLADVLYMTRVQKERFSPESDFDKVRAPYILDTRALKLLSPRAFILHPLPRVGEIASVVDEDPRAKYFTQASLGVCVRMALLKTMLRKTSASDRLT